MLISHINLLFALINIKQVAGIQIILIMIEVLLQVSTHHWGVSLNVIFFKAITYLTKTSSFSFDNSLENL